MYSLNPARITEACVAAFQEPIFMNPIFMDSPNTLL